MSPKLPTYITASHPYELVGNHKHAAGLSKSRRVRLHLVLAAFLLAFGFISGLWFKSHPTFFKDYRIAKSLSVDAHIVLHPQFIPYEYPATSQDMPVPQLEASILGETSATPKWKSTATSSSILAYPRVIQPGPSAPTTSEILFAMATNADRAISQARWWLWPSFLSNPSSPCFVLLPPEDAHRVEEVVAEFQKQGIDCIAIASKEKRYQLRVLSLPGEAMRAFQKRGEGIRWLIMGDDDTLWLDKNGLLRLLGQYDDREMKFIASTSERTTSLGAFGRMSFGGGGLLLSSGLVSKYIEVLPECQRRWPRTFGGDEGVNNCAALAQGIDNREQAYINEPSLHQFDVYGLATGFLEAGLPMTTIHHFFSWSKIMPEWMHKNDDYRILRTIIDAAHFLGQDNMFKRYSLDGGRTILVNGYSITTYLEPMTPEELAKMEWTWSHADDAKLATEQIRPPVRIIGHDASPEDQPGTQRKSPYYLHAVNIVDKARGRATFVYRNERGREITVDWVEGQ